MSDTEPLGEHHHDRASLEDYKQAGRLDSWEKDKPQWHFEGEETQTIEQSGKESCDARPARIVGLAHGHADCQANSWVAGGETGAVGGCEHLVANGMATDVDVVEEQHVVESE